MVRRTSVLTIVEQLWHPLPGGTAVATVRTLNALAELDRVGEFALSGLAARHRPDRVRPELSTLPASMTVAFHRLPRPMLYESWVRRGRPRVDHGLDGEVVWAASGVVPGSARPVVTTIHDLDFLHHPDHLTRRGRGFFPRMWAAARDRTDHFVCPSAVVGRDLQAAGVDPAKVSVIPWAVSEPECPAPEAQAVRRALGLPDRYVLWVGPLLGRKNPEGAAAAMRSVDCDLVMVGARGGPNTGEEAIDRLGCRVHRLGPVSDRELSALYREARALLYPSRAEGFGLPVAEAMAHGTPVVTAAGTATEELAAGAALLVEPDDHDAIGAALAVAVADGPDRRRLVAAGRARAAELSWGATAAAYAEVFRRVGWSR